MRAYAHARSINSNQKLMHEIAHAGFITDADMGQFAALNIAVDISPYLWFPSPILDNIKSVLPERGVFYWPNKTLLEMGATIIAGSDWPSVSPSISPWPGIEATVTRKNPTGDVPGVHWPEERLSLEQTLEIFTRNGAKALLLDHKIGSLEVGKYANIIVLNHNLFTISPDDISETIVEQTWFKGKNISQKTPE